MSTTVSVYTPQVYIPQSEYSKHTIFLAGSIEMGKAEDWQSKIVNNLKHSRNPLGNIVVFNPRRDDWDSTWVQSIDNPQFNGQVQWELDHLDKADYIFLYFSPGTISPISLLEFGLYVGKNKDKLIVCCPDGFERKGNVDIVCQRANIKVYAKFDDAFRELTRRLWL